MTLQTYQRPEIDKRGASVAAEYAAKMMAGKNHRERVAIVALLIAENARLTKECNDHRAARGFEPLPTWDPK